MYDRQTVRHLFSEPTFEGKPMKYYEIVSVTRSVTMFATGITVFTVCHSLSESVTLNITKLEQSFFESSDQRKFLRHCCCDVALSMHTIHCFYA